MSERRLDEGTWLHAGVGDDAAARLGLLRRRLALAAGCAPADLVIERLPEGKPILAAPRRDLWFSSASRDGVVALAVSEAGPVGVDVETLAACQSALDAASLFSDLERRWLDSLPEAKRALGFARLWTGKEAVLKAHGRGVAQGLAQPDFAASSNGIEPPWAPVVAALDGAPYTVCWYTSIVDEAFIIAARADKATGRLHGTS